MVDKINARNKTVNIALVGKYCALHDAYLSVVEALNHGGFDNQTNVEIKWIDAEDITIDSVQEIFNNIDGIIVPGGFGERGIEGMIKTAEYARKNNIPYLGICLGMQIACIEFARNVLGYTDANSKEFDPTSEHQIINLMEDQKYIANMGGTLRLGNYLCNLKNNSLAHNIYQKDIIEERHRHRYEFNNDYREEFNKNGLEIVGTSLDNLLVEVVENKNCKFFIAAQYHPEFKSRPNRPHPLFTNFIKASLSK